MIKLQTPSLPIPQQAVEIDAAILDLQAKLSLNLGWLSHNWGKIFRNVDTSTGSTLFFPEVFLGKQDNSYNYHRIGPDNDLMGQCFFVVGPEQIESFELGEYSYLSYNVGIVFMVNMELINASLLATEIFEQNLISEVRDVLTRQSIGAFYKLTINNVQREFNQVFAEFNIDENRGVSHSPLDEFRFNLNILVPEQCPVSLDRCAALQNNISSDDLTNCIIPNLSVQQLIAGLTTQQIDDLKAIICL